MAQKNEELQKYLKNTADKMQEHCTDSMLGKLTDVDRDRYNTWLECRMATTISYMLGHLRECEKVENRNRQTLNLRGPLLLKTKA